MGHAPGNPILDTDTARDLEIKRLRAEVARLEDRWSRIANELINANAAIAELVEALAEIESRAHNGEWTLPSSFANRARAAIAKAKEEGMIPSIDEAKLYGRIHQLEASNAALVAELERIAEWLRMALYGDLTVTSKKIHERIDAIRAAIAAAKEEK
jgi:chromosome segregation ATPase